MKKCAMCNMPLPKFLGQWISPTNGSTICAKCFSDYFTADQIAALILKPAQIEHDDTKPLPRCRQCRSVLSMQHRCDNWNCPENPMFNRSEEKR